MIDFDNIAQDFSLETALRDDHDGSVARSIIDYVANAKRMLGQESLSDEQQAHMSLALATAEEVMPELWQFLHPDKQW